jgi:uncharacterized protein YdcH (DUF465 family)
MPEKINQLKIHNPYLRELFGEYQELEYEIHQINTREDVAIDQYRHTKKARCKTCFFSFNHSLNSH